MGDALTAYLGVIGHLLRELHAVGILTEDLALPEDQDDLEATYRGLCRAPREGSKRRRIDFLAVPWQCRGAALLYYTVRVADGFLSCIISHFSFNLGGRYCVFLPFILWHNRRLWSFF